MANDLSLLRLVPAANAAPAGSELVTCPLCHTASSLTAERVAQGEDFRCGRCSQRWDGETLAGAAAYASWLQTRALAH